MIKLLIIFFLGIFIGQISFFFAMVIYHNKITLGNIIFDQYDHSMEIIVNKSYDELCEDDFQYRMFRMIRK